MEIKNIRVLQKAEKYARGSFLLWISKLLCKTVTILYYSTKKRSSLFPLERIKD